MIKITKNVNDMTEDEINLIADSLIDECFEGMATEENKEIANSISEYDDFQVMFDRYNNGDKVRDICKDYDISVESFYKGIKKYQDAEAGIEPDPEPEVKKPAPKKTKKTKKTAEPKTESKPKADPEPEVKKPVNKPEPKAEPKAVPAAATTKSAVKLGSSNGVYCWMNSPDGIIYIKEFVKAKGKAGENSTIKTTTDPKEAKVWRTMYAAVDFLCKREKDTTGWNISHQ